MDIQRHIIKSGPFSGVPGVRVMFGKKSLAPKKIVKKIKNLAVTRMVMLHGKATYHSNLGEIVEAILRNGYWIHISTDGVECPAHVQPIDKTVFFTVAPISRTVHKVYHNATEFRYFIDKNTKFTKEGYPKQLFLPDNKGLIALSPKTAHDTDFARQHCMDHGIFFAI